MLANQLIESGNDYWTGYDIKNENVVNMEESGIIDPSKVTCAALENAASAAGSILLTECTIVDHPEKVDGVTPDQVF